MGRILTIFNAAKDGNLEHLIKNIEKHVDVNAIDKDGYTPAHIAAANGKVNILEYLFSHGANFNFHTELNYTPLELAVLWQRTNSVKFLVENISDLIWGSSCHYASAIGAQKILLLLLSHGAPVDLLDESGRSAAHWAAQEGQLEILNILYSYHADWNILDHDGSSVLYIATSENHLEVMDYLIKTGAEIDFTENTTPFMIACAFHNYKAAERLIKAGADVNYRDKDGRTALFYAKVKGDRKMQEFLCNRGANINITDNMGVSINDLLNSQIRERLYSELYS